MIDWDNPLESSLGWVREHSERYADTSGEDGHRMSALDWAAKVVEDNGRELAESLPLPGEATGERQTR